MSRPTIVDNAYTFDLRTLAKAKRAREQETRSIAAAERAIQRRNESSQRRERFMDARVMLLTDAGDATADVSEQQMLSTLNRLDAFRQGDLLKMFRPQHSAYGEAMRPPAPGPNAESVYVHAALPGPVTPEAVAWAVHGLCTDERMSMVCAHRDLLLRLGRLQPSLFTFPVTSAFGLLGVRNFRQGYVVVRETRDSRDAEFPVAERTRCIHNLRALLDVLGSCFGTFPLETQLVTLKLVAATVADSWLRAKLIGPDVTRTLELTDISTISAGQICAHLMQISNIPEAQRLVATHLPRCSSAWLRVGAEYGLHAFLDARNDETGEGFTYCLWHEALRQVPDVLETRPLFRDAGRREADHALLQHKVALLDLGLRAISYHSERASLLRIIDALQAIHDRIADGKAVVLARSQSKDAIHRLAARLRHTMTALTHIT